MRDLPPEIRRQRLVVEGSSPEPIDAAATRDYLSELFGCTADFVAANQIVWRDF